MKVNKKFYKRKIEILVIIFMFLVCFIGIGYASLTTDLKILGSTNVAGTSWDIHFDNIEVITNTGLVVVSEPKFNDNKDQVMFDIEATARNMKYLFTFDIVNDGGIGAMIKNVSSLTNEYVDYLDYSITYDDGSEIRPFDKIDKKSSKKIKVSLSTKNFIVEPDDDLIVNLKWGLDFVQADKNAVSR